MKWMSPSPRRLYLVKIENCWLWSMHTWCLRLCKTKMLSFTASQALTAEWDTINGKAEVSVSQDAASTQCSEGKKQWLAPCATCPPVVTFSHSHRFAERRRSFVRSPQTYKHYVLYSGFVFFWKCEFHGYQLTCLCFANGSAGQYL